jgi:hypothetical protein
MEHVLGLLANLAIHFFMNPSDVSLPKGVTIFGTVLGFSLAIWPLGSNEASFLLGDDGGFMIIDGGGLGRGSEMVWRLNGGGGLGSGDGGALRDGGFRDVGSDLGSKGV